MQEELGSAIIWTGSPKSIKTKTGNQVDLITGSMKIGETEYALSGFNNKSKDGKDYLRLRVTAPYQATIKESEF